MPEPAVLLAPESQARLKRGVDTLASNARQAFANAGIIVQLVKSTMILVDGKEVTEFQLDARYQYPDSSAIRTQPVALSVR